MKTVLTIDPIEAAHFIKNGGTVAFPTETVYGLGANVFDANAVAAIFEAKRRPADNPLIVHIAVLAQIAELAAETTVAARKLIDAFFPGPLTVVMRKTASVPMITTAGLHTIGVRMPRAELGHQFLAACGVPVAAPSANLSGSPSPTRWEAVAEDLEGRVDCILRGERTEIGLESTVVDCTAEVPVLLRSGSVTLEHLRAVVPATVRYADAPSDEIRSPGMKHRHYSPAAMVVIVEGAPEMVDDCTAYIGIENLDENFLLKKICVSVDDYARNVFEFFRNCDRNKIKTIYCQRVGEDGIGAALMDRLRRAAAG